MLADILMLQLFHDPYLHWRPLRQAGRPEVASPRVCRAGIRRSVADRFQRLAASAHRAFSLELGQNIAHDDISPFYPPFAHRTVTIEQRRV
jgi:hypothetical protein